MTDVGQERRRISDPKVLRALAHPARVAIIEDLSGTGEGRTATELAEIVGLSPSATSYHLRELAKVGLIEQAPSRGDGRERVWQSPSQAWGVDMERDADPETQAAEDELIAMYVDRDYARLRAFLARSRQEPPEWHDAAGLNSTTVLVTAAELRELFEQVQRLIGPLRVREREGAAPEGARTARVHFAVFPDD